MEAGTCERPLYSMPEWLADILVDILVDIYDILRDPATTNVLLCIVVVLLLSVRERSDTIDNRLQHLLNRRFGVPDDLLKEIEYRLEYIHRIMIDLKEKLYK